MRTWTTIAAMLMLMAVIGCKKEAPAKPEAEKPAVEKPAEKAPADPATK